MKKKILLITIILLAIVYSMHAQRPLTSDNRSPFVQVVKDIRESVVNISVEYEVKYGGMSSRLPLNDDFFKFFFPDPYRNREPQRRKSMAMGSGFIFKQEQNEVYILTNNHVVSKGEEGEITVTLADKAKYEAQIVGLDSETDLAVIKIEIDSDENIVVAPLGDSNAIEIADWVIAIGNPFGQLGLERTVTVGVVSAKGRANLRFGKESPIYQDYIQTDAAINPGNSGGPLVNIKGEVVGVNAAITSTSGGNVGIGFAIPANIANKVSNDLIEHGEVRRAYMGILPQDITVEIQKSFDLDEIKGVLVAKVEEDTPAEDAGLKRGDVIITFDGKEISNMAKFRLIVANSAIDKNLPLTVIRDKKKKHLIIQLIERPDDYSEINTINLNTSSDEIGVKVKDLNSEFAKSLDIDEKEGVVISKIYPNSPASRSSLGVGDIILEINKKTIKNVKDFDNIISHKDRDSLLLYVKTKSGAYVYVPIKLK